MEDQPEPINGAALAPEKPRTDLSPDQLATSQAIDALVREMSGHGTDLLVIQVAIQSQQLQAVMGMLFAPRGALPPLLDSTEYNRRIRLGCRAAVEAIRKPRLAVVTDLPRRP